MATVAAGDARMTRELVGDRSEPNGSLPAERGAPEPRDAIVLSDAVAREVGDLFAASEHAARAIRDKAQADAELLMRTATREAARQAQLAVAAVASESVPQLEARVSELRALVEGVRADVDRLTQDLGRLASGAAPASLPPAPESAEPAASAEDRRALLIALNMASNGASREEAARFLVDQLGVSDPEKLLEAVYGYVGPDQH